MSFPCTGCGCCCKVIDWADKIIVRDDPTHPYYFPYTHKEGVCEKLIDNKCSVYESRPLICRIEDSMPKGYNQTAYYNINIEACHHLIGVIPGLIFYSETRFKICSEVLLIPLGLCAFQNIRKLRIPDSFRIESESN